MAQDSNTQRKIVWHDAGVQSLQADVAQVKASKEEFMLFFGASRSAEAGQNELWVRLGRRIVLNPLSAKRLALQLDRVIREYEARFGYLDGNALLQERLEPTPPLQPPSFKSTTGAEKAGVLFQFLAGQNISPAFERSCEFQEKQLFGNRFLLGFEKRMIQGRPDEKLLEVCRHLGMPADFLDPYREHLPEASIVGFGFGEDEGVCMIKAYLEFGARFFKAVKSSSSDPGPYLSHLGFKWEAEDNCRKAFATYTCFPNRSCQGVLEKLSGTFYRPESRSPFGQLKGILELASNKMHPERFHVLDVKEQSNPRSSFDINVYSANLPLKEIYSFLLKISRHFSIPEERFQNWYEPVKGHILGHLAGGLDRRGRDFITLYFGE